MILAFFYSELMAILMNLVEFVVVVVGESPQLQDSFNQET